MFSGGDEGSGAGGRDRKWAMMKKMEKISEDLITTVETEKKQ